jgi:hypothetical protein
MALPKMKVKLTAFQSGWFHQLAESIQRYFEAALSFRNQMDQAGQRSDLQLMRMKGHPELNDYPGLPLGGRSQVNSLFAP